MGKIRHPKRSWWQPTALASALKPGTPPSPIPLHGDLPMTHLKQPLGPNQILWIEALRFGGYAQGKEVLSRDNKFCCLGVACEIFKATLDLEVSPASGSNTITYNGVYGTAPFRVIEHLGLYGDVGDARPASDGSPLAHLNDESGYSFLEIADLIEDDPSVYFRSPQ